MNVPDAAGLKEVERLVKAAEPAKRIVEAPDEPEGVYYVVGADGGMTRTTALIPHASETAADLETLAEVAKRRKEEYADGFVSVWYDRSRVQAVQTWHDSPADVCSIGLHPSPQLALLTEWRNKARVTVSQKEFVLLLRTTLAGCWDRQPTLLAAVRRLRTQKSADGSSEAQRGRVSLTRSMVAEMSGVGDIPEMVTFEVPVFDGAAVRESAAVRVVLDPDPETEQFLVVVLPEEIERAFAAGEERVQDMLDGLLADAGIPIYHGRP